MSKRKKLPYTVVTICVNYHNRCFWQQTRQLSVKRRRQLHSREEVVQTLHLHQQLVTLSNNTASLTLRRPLTQSTTTPPQSPLKGQHCTHTAAAAAAPESSRSQRELNEGHPAHRHKNLKFKLKLSYDSILKLLAIQPFCVI